MSPLSVFRSVLQALDEGSVIRVSVARALNVLGVLFGLVGLYLLVEMLKTSFRLPTEATIGGLIMAILFAAAVVAVVQILFYRARNIIDTETSPFTVIPIAAIMFRAMGEIYATLGVAIGVGGCIFIWLSGFSPFQLIRGLGAFFPGIPAEATFLSGLLFLFSMVFAAFVGLLAFYLIAESTVVLVDIAKNIRLLVKGSPKATGA